MFYAYILQSDFNGRFYIGSTKDIANRIDQHNSGRTPSTKPFRPWRLVHSEEFETLVDARKRETEIKSWKSHDYICKTFGLKP
jgi:putative endonuclease